ncbi:MAG: nucleoside hydrolase [Nitrospinae bacterium]|nr:nucleoside hydrolase [Nitrospinota bacterium]
MKRVIVDTDPGIDDAAALLLALASPELSVEAVTTVYGNGTLEECTRNALRILETAGRGDIPVYQGVGKPLLGEPRFAHHIHGSDALGGVGVPAPVGAPQAKHAVRELVDRVLASPGEVTLIALGPLTNVALALSIAPRMGTALAELVLMGGAVLTHGNATEVASANLYNDPESAALVYQSGVPLVQVGMDVCQKTTVLEEQLARLRQAHTPTTMLLARITPHLIASYAERGLKPHGTGVHYNDVPAIAYVIAPWLYDIRAYYVRISTHDPLTRGQTVADVANLWRQPPNAKVLLGVDAAQLTEMFTTRVVGYVTPDKTVRHPPTSP